MNSIDEILKAALLGTDKTPPQSVIASLPQAVQQELAQLATEDDETSFLELSAFMLSYYRAGQEFPIVNIDTANQNNSGESENENFPPTTANRLLGALISENRYSLLPVWLTHCAERSHKIAPQYLPQLLKLGEEDIALQQQLTEVIGERGHWLASLNDDWQVFQQTTQEIWETGASRQRKQLFQYLLQHGRSKATELLQSTWKEENATDRFDFLSAWGNPQSAEELALLETMLQDKSKKVTALAQQLLLRQPESTLTQQFHQQCSQLLTSKEGGMLGIGSAKIEVNTNVDLGVWIKEFGLESESLDKNFSDQEYQAFQVLSLIQPKVWEEQLSLSPEKILKPFITDKSLQKYLPAWAATIAFHRNSSWADAWLDFVLASNATKALLENTPSVLPGASPETLTRLFNHKRADTILSANNIIPLLDELCFPWSLDFSKAALKLLYRNFAQRGVYHYETEAFMRLAERMPTEILAQQEEFLPPKNEKRDTWRTMLRDLFRTIELKTKIPSSFDE
ncbi:MAG: DUF5691 domain-containing protein [Bacteroidota bacterium]